MCLITNNQLTTLDAALSKLLEQNLKDPTAAYLVSARQPAVSAGQLTWLQLGRASDLSYLRPPGFRPQQADASLVARLAALHSLRIRPQTAAIN